MRIATGINITDEERRFLLELADRRRSSIRTPEPVLLSLVRKGLIQFDLSSLGDELAKELVKGTLQR
jgi:hypothetical protein